MGLYYFGEGIEVYRKTYKISRAEILEAVLEGIEEWYSDGKEFKTWPFAQAIGVWGHRVGHCLKWLEHVGILERRKVGSANVWKVRTDGTK